MKALVIGGGPAGIATVGWLHRYEAPYEWVDRYGEVGGMLRTVHNPIVDFPGIRGADGVEVAETLARWTDETMPPPARSEVASIRVSAAGFDVRLDERDVQFDQVVLATGTRRRRLDVPGEREGEGDYVRMSTTRNPEEFAGRHVAVVGGADAAVEGCLNLARAGAEDVLLIARSELKAQRHFLEEMRETNTIQRYDGEVEVTRVSGTDAGCELSLNDGNSLQVAAVFVRIGVVPVLPPIEPADIALALDEAGFVLVDERCETSIPGLYAVGDVTSTPLRSIATCLGDGARAGRSVAEALGVWPRASNE